MTSLRKKLQILMIKLWAHSSAQKKDTYYTIDKLEIASLMPPIEEKSKEDQIISANDLSN